MSSGRTSQIYAFGVAATILPSYYSHNIKIDEFRFSTPDSTEPNKWDKTSIFSAILHVHFGYQSYLPKYGLFSMAKARSKTRLWQSERVEDKD